MRRKLRTLDGGFVFINPEEVAVLATTNVVGTTAAIVRMCPQPFMVRGNPVEVDAVLRGERETVENDEERPSGLIT